MAYSRDWSKLIPIDHTKFKDIPGAVRNLRQDLEERLKNFMYGFTAGETSEGLKYAPLLAQGTAPTTSAATVCLYAQTDANGIAQFYLKDGTGNAIQVSKGGKLMGLSSDVWRSGDMIPSTNTGAPTGWTDISSTYEGKFLRISTGTPLEAGGSDTDSVTLETANLPAHAHAAGTLATASDGAHTHTIGFAGGGSGSVPQQPYQVSADPAQDYSTTSSSGAHTHAMSGSTANAGSGTAFTVDTVPAYIRTRMYRKD